MTDPFEARLAATLAPPEREPDRAFVLQVRANVLLAERLEASRKALVRRLIGQFAAVAAVAAAVALVGLSPPVARLAAESGPGTLLALLLSFSFVALLLVPAMSRTTTRFAAQRGFART